MDTHGPWKTECRQLGEGRDREESQPRYNDKNPRFGVEKISVSDTWVCQLRYNIDKSLDLLERKMRLK